MCAKFENNASPTFLIIVLTPFIQQSLLYKWCEYNWAVGSFNMKPYSPNPSATGLWYVNISSHNGLWTSRQWVIIWTNNCLVFWRTYAWFCLDEVSVCNADYYPVRLVIHCKFSGASWCCIILHVIVISQFTLGIYILTHWGIVMPFGDIDLGQHWHR